ncbi:MAG TPA: hypothetical protein VII34_10760 [Pyrinomonadaceae bacterium]
MNVKPSIGFLTKDGEAPFTDKVTTLLEWMTNNTKYPTPTPALTVVQTAFDAYKVATADAAQGGKENTAIRNARRAELVSLLRQLANYVDATANGDLETLISSGFPIQKTQRTPIGPLPAPDAPSVSQGPVTGTLRAVISPVYGAYAYHWRLALASAPTVYVQTALTTGGRVLFEDLTAGQVYNVEANAVGSAGTSDWSDVGSLMVI